jgi:hypothetical protein
MIEQELVEAYFESNGFLVRKGSSSVVAQKSGSKKRTDMLPVITVMNPRVFQNDSSLNVRLFSADLKKIRSAKVATLGWGNSSFSVASLSNDVQLQKFFKTEVDGARIEDCFSSNPEWQAGESAESLKILVVPALPQSTDRLQKLVEHFKSYGLDGVLTLGSILENLLRLSKPSLQYDGHQVLQTLRLVKAYGLSKDPQLEIFQED